MGYVDVLQSVHVFVVVIAIQHVWASEVVHGDLWPVRQRLSLVAVIGVLLSTVRRCLYRAVTVDDDEALDSFYSSLSWTTCVTRT